MAISSPDFYSMLRAKGICFFTGVPDSLLKDLCACIDDKTGPSEHIIAANEGNAIAIAAGHYLRTGNLPAVYMQNSGLGNAVNPLLSLCDREIYAIPMLLLIGWRGEPGMKDAIQHVKDGRIQEDLLKTMEVPYEIISGDEGDAAVKVDRIISVAITEHRPVALLFKHGVFKQYKALKAAPQQGQMSREQALDIILVRVDTNALAFITTGKISREVFEIRRKNGQSHQRDFLTVGSMGHCSSMALGAALAHDSRQVFCIDGDGALIMHMGALAIIGAWQPANFKHIVINNGAHESVGGQPTVGFKIDIGAIAKACGYHEAYRVESTQDLSQKVNWLVSAQGPVLLEVVVKQGSREDLGRPTTSTIEDKIAFMNA